MNDKTNKENFAELEKAAEKLDDVNTVEVPVIDSNDEPEHLDTSEAIDQVQALDQGDFADDDLKDVIMVTSETYLKNFPQLQVTDGEATRLSKVYVTLLNKWFKNANFKFKEEITAVAVTAIVVLPRYQMLREYGRQTALHNGKDQARENIANQSSTAQE